ncbi:YqcI/YcgG family protein [Knoellia locipacati]
MGAPTSSFDVYAALRRREADERSAPLVAVFAGPVPKSDDGLEDLLWETLQHLSDFDEVPWSDGVVAALDTGDHVVVVAGEAWTVDALHPHATESSRRAPWPALVIRPATAPRVAP